MELDETKQDKKIEELHKKEAEELAAALSERYGIEYLDLSRISINTDGLRLIPEGKARSAGIAVFGMIGKKLSVATKSPNKEEVLQLVEDLKKRGYAVTLYLVSAASLERAWERYKDLSFASETKAGVLDISSEEIAKLLAALTDLSKIKTAIEEVIAMKKAYRISRILETVLAGSLA